MKEREREKKILDTRFIYLLYIIRFPSLFFAGNVEVEVLIKRGKTVKDIIIAYPFVETCFFPKIVVLR